MTQAYAEDNGRFENHAAHRNLLSDEEQARRIRRLIGIVLYRRRFIAVATFSIFLLAVVLIMLTPREYSAEAFLAIDPRKTDIVDITAVLANVPADIEGIATEVQVLQSPSLAARVLAEIDKNRPDRGDNGVKEASSNPLSWVSAQFAEIRRMLWGANAQPDAAATTDSDSQRIRSFLGHLSVAQQHDSRVIAVSFSSHQPKQAAEAVNTLVNLYLQDQVSVKKAATEQAHHWISEQLAGLRRNLLEAEQAASDFRNAHHLISGRDHTSPASQQLSDLSARLIQVQTHRAQLDAQLDEVRRLMASGAGAGALNNVLQSQTISHLREQEAQVARDLAKGLRVFGPQYPRVEVLSAALADTAKQIASETDRIVSDIKLQSAQARQEQAILTTAISEAEARIGKQNDATIQLEELERQAAAQRQLLTTFLARSKETAAEANYQTPDGRVVSYASVPTAPSSPKVPLTFYAAFAVALGVATCLAFVRELLDDRIRNGDDIPRLGVPLLGMMPVTRTQPVHEHLAQRPFSAIGESIRNVLTSLLLNGGNGRQAGPQNVFAVTSSLPGEGKTTVVTSIARLVAMTGRRILVIDCDMHRPKVHREFGLDDGPGVAEVLSGRLTGAEAVIHDARTGIDVMPAGKDRSSNLLSTAPLVGLIGHVRMLYDLVLIDSGPVLAVSNARVISQSADATIYVARWSGTRKAHISAGLQQLHDIGSTVAGIVVTMVDVKSHSRYSFTDASAYHRLVKKYYLQ